MEEHIVRDGETGEAIVSSTGTRVDDILEAIDSTGSVDGALRRFPGLTTEAVSATLKFARVASRRELRYQPEPGYGVHELRERPLAYAGEQRGVTIAVPANEYGDLLYRLDLLEGIFESERDLEQGPGIPHDEVFAQLRSRFGG
jgi:uncharacterized protein (DUF433 family)